MSTLNLLWFNPLWPTSTTLTNQVKDLINPLKNQVKEQIPFTWTLQGEQTQAQSLTNPKSSKLFYNEIERKEKYVMIT